MRTGIPCEKPGQALVAATPQTVSRLVRLGYEVHVQRGAGQAASFPDSAYEEAGARVTDEAQVWDCEVVLGVDAPDEEHLALMSPGTTYVGRLAPARSPRLVEALRARGLTGLALDAVPRISRAQAMDVLSSQANLAGYRAVIEAAAHFGRVFTGQVTAAGKLPPASVYVIGAGVAGLAAIGTASSLGAQVRGTDVRPEVEDQVRSMGATFIPVPSAPGHQEASSDGYARQMSAEQAELAAALYAKEAAQADIVITTASVPGRQAPVLLSRAALEGMRPGSVVVDMAAANGGNTELTVPSEVVLTDGGVTIVGYTDLAGRLPTQASQLYGQNLVNLLTLMTPAKDGVLRLDLEDQVVRGITVTHAGEILWPPPAVTVSAAPTAGAGTVPPATQAPDTSAASQEAAQNRARSAARARRAGLVAAALALAALVLVTPVAVASHYIVLMLAVVLGFYVISNVTPALHTPLMSVTNAISGIILLGAISQVGNDNLLVSAVSFLAVVLASVNVFGGFAVTHRMLAMFRKD
ncbi:Re/Si-specific NAD(P)(+) transhydrogenase subunit alpha [Actinomyces sp. 2119]|uniref:proton-translocating NAD(P)(+) transhydrogenase n=1 Tax=Actinomyces lilanjuaniae TaxID=2321394 RepID=A0ABM6Z2I4_9ACTO|nr:MULTISPECIES: Re/Si-specific NAD(P)(+) transhydrogenase subunit alpha [Actinomyces]AYD89332.1 Re/Si-specific NAD(P)(+) transhydrogenase subunit alpha [Actinomyces lilanjuaniae]RJF40755.1 Re/Si-specific NAD(P)(+) transhydrogenase subunit alpha [Actinomyces sp. 2119]